MEGTGQGQINYRASEIFPQRHRLGAIQIFPRITPTPQMKPEEINVAICEVIHGKDCEIEYINPASGMEPSGWRMSDENGDDAPVPNYYGDLNAIHEAEKLILTKFNSGARYRLFLANNSAGPNAKFPTVEAAICHATAPQRCEAFLKTLGKWVETKGEGE